MKNKNITLENLYNKAYNYENFSNWRFNRK